MHISSLEENLEGISQREMRLRTLCRELEQKNDELEQRDRYRDAFFASRLIDTLATIAESARESDSCVAMRSLHRGSESNATIEYLQERLDKITEQYVLSQGELETLRVSSDEVIERLKDEVRGPFIHSFVHSLMGA